MKHSRKILTFSVTILLLVVVMPGVTNAQMSQVKTVWVILMENHNWTGNNSGAQFGDPDIKGSLLAPYANGELLYTAAHAEQYFNPPGNHPSQPNYLWLEAGTNFGVLADTQPGQPQLYHAKHLVRLLENAGISWTSYAEPDFGSPVFDICPLDFTYLDVEHLALRVFQRCQSRIESEVGRVHRARPALLSTGNRSGQQDLGAVQLYYSQTCVMTDMRGFLLVTPRKQRQHAARRHLAEAKCSYDHELGPVQGRWRPDHRLG